ncbi:MAG: transposase [Candidatus Omnitrophota bacterium]
MPKIITRKSNIRLKEYDYSQSNYYFITACCENKLKLFGAVINDEMVLNGAGKMVEQTLIEIPNFYHGLSLDTHIIMPNHIHAIIIIQNNKLTNNGQAQGPVPTYLSLSDIIHRIKTLSTKKYIDGVKNNGWPRFNKKIWQRSFHDHIIRDEKSLNNIREYIRTNPATWDRDIENPNNIDNIELNEIRV